MILAYSGSAELAAVGVSASIFNLVSKLFNVPLLNITTSFVAEEQATMDKDSGDPRQLSNGNYRFLPDTYRSYVVSSFSINKLCFSAHLILFHLHVFPPFSGLSSEHQTKKFLPSISTSLALAACLGIAETVALLAGSGFLMDLMGINVVCLAFLSMILV